MYRDILPSGGPSALQRGAELLQTTLAGSGPAGGGGGRRRPGPTGGRDGEGEAIVHPLATRGGGGAPTVSITGSRSAAVKIEMGIAPSQPRPKAQWKRTSKPGTVFATWMNVTDEIAEEPSASTPQQLSWCKQNKASYDALKNSLDLTGNPLAILQKDTAPPSVPKTKKSVANLAAIAAAAGSPVKPEPIPESLALPWTPAEVDYLMELCFECDLLWPVVYDRYEWNELTAPTPGIVKEPMTDDGAPGTAFESPEYRGHGAAPMATAPPGDWTTRPPGSSDELGGDLSADTLQEPPSEFPLAPSRRSLEDLKARFYYILSQIRDHRDIKKTAWKYDPIADRTRRQLAESRFEVESSLAAREERLREIVGTLIDILESPVVESALRTMQPVPLKTKRELRDDGTQASAEMATARDSPIAPGAAEAAAVFADTETSSNYSSEDLQQLQRELLPLTNLLNAVYKSKGAALVSNLIRQANENLLTALLQPSADSAGLTTTTTTTSTVSAPRGGGGTGSGSAISAAQAKELNEGMDKVLRQACKNFDPSSYGRLPNETRPETYFTTTLQTFAPYFASRSTLDAYAALRAEAAVTQQILKHRDRVQQQYDHWATKLSELRRALRSARRTKQPGGGSGVATVATVGGGQTIAATGITPRQQASQLAKQARQAAAATAIGI